MMKSTIIHHLCVMGAYAYISLSPWKLEGIERGLSLIPGEVKRFESEMMMAHSLPIPKVGWNAVKFNEQISVDSEKLSRFYFTHSYAAAAPSNEPADTMGDGCSAQAFYYLNQHQQEVVGAVVQGKFVGLQFHPEKSGRHGLNLLRSILTSSPF